MTPRDRRLAVLILSCGTALAVAVLAWPWLRANVVGPVALVIWLLLRLLVLSIHQAVYWIALVLAVPALLWALLRRHTVSAAPPFPAARAMYAHPVDTWRWLVEQTAGGTRVLPSLGWNGFVQLAVSLRAVERRVPPDYRLHDAMRAGEVPLPPEVHAFLFPAPCPPAGGRAARLGRWLTGAPRDALRRLSGRERTERIRAMSQLLSFLENSLELTSHDDPDERARR